MKKNVKKFRNKYLPSEDNDRDWKKWPESTRKARRYFSRNYKQKNAMLLDVRKRRDAMRVLLKLAARLYPGRLYVSDKPYKFPMYKLGMLTYETAKQHTIIPSPWYDVKVQKIIVSDAAKKRILVRMKEISEYVNNCGVIGEQLAKRMREFK